MFVLLFLHHPHHKMRRKHSTTFKNSPSILVYYTDYFYVYIHVRLLREKEWDLDGGCTYVYALAFQKWLIIHLLNMYEYLGMCYSRWLFLLLALFLFLLLIMLYVSLLNSHHPKTNFFTSTLSLCIFIMICVYMHMDILWAYICRYIISVYILMLMLLFVVCNGLDWHIFAGLVT